MHDCYLVIDWPLPRLGGPLSFLRLEPRVALQHHPVRLKELGDET